MLAEIRALAGANVCAVLVLDPERPFLRPRWCVPGRFQHLRLHPVHSGCALARAIELRKPVREDELDHDGDPACDPCGRLFGAPAVFAVPVSVGDQELAIIAAFARPKACPTRRRSRAYSLACHLGAFLAGEAVARQAERRALELALVNEVGAHLTAVIHPELLFPRILAEVGRAIPHDVAGLYLFDASERRLRLMASRGFSQDRQGQLAEVAWEGLPGTVFRSRQPAIVPDLQPESDEAPGSPAVAFLPGIRSAILAPVVAGGEALGVIGLGRARPRAFGEREQALLVTLASHVAIAVANAKTYQAIEGRLQSKLRDLANLSQIGQAIGATLQTDTVLNNIVRHTAEAFGSSASAIFLLDEERGEVIIAAAHGFNSNNLLRRMPVTGSATGWVLRHGRTLFVPSVPGAVFESIRAWFEREGIESFIGVPLVARGKAIGSLNVYSRRGARFEPSDVELLQGLAAQATIAIDHAKLFESVAQEKAKLEAIVESLQDGLVLVNSIGAIVYASRRFVDLAGIDRGCLSGMTIDRVWGWLAGRSAIPTDVGRHLETLDSSSLDATVLSLVQPRRQDLEIQGFTVQAAGGEPLGRGYLLRDVTQKADIERLKASILSTVSHELRTPLAAIKGFATTLLRTDTEWDEASKRDFVEQIDQETDRLGLLVRNLLDMSRLEAGTVRLDREWCDLSDLVADVVARMARVVANHEIHLALGDRPIVALLDRRYLERVVWNLVENAVKYSPRGSPITVGLARHGTDVVLSVADRGIGLKLDEQALIFERFYRGAGARTTTGVGLGLAICRGIVEAHGGAIAVESEPGCGATFFVRLPGN